jgi:CPA2 family monovalent cation:H+ antiporter-2
MAHDTPLITTIVAAFVLAFVFGTVANRFKLPPLVGYLIAGIVCGPYSPGFVADLDLASQLSEIGVILLMFGVGLHFSLKDLMSVRALAIPGALVQITFATLLGVGLGTLLGWGLGAGLIFGLALSCASTVVLLKAMQDRRLIETERGRIAVGWLIVEDVLCVLVLVLIPALAPLLGGDMATTGHDPFISLVERLAGTDFGLGGVVAITLVKIAAFIGFMLVVGRRIIPWLLHAIAHTGNRELFRLAVLAVALGVALGAAYLFGVSLALGAFFAGMILSESELSHRAAQETLPLRDAFAVLFFVAVGMLFNPETVLADPLPVLATLAIIIFGKSLAAFLIVILFRRPVATALTISASLAQIGEFSFIIAAMGVALHILPNAGNDLILAGALLSIILNPLVFWVSDRLRPRMEARVAARRGEPVPEAEPIEPVLEPAAEAPAEAAVAEGEDEDTVVPTRLTGHTILIGFGRVGSVVGAGLAKTDRPFLVIEDSDHSVAAARALGIEVVVGNAAAADVLHLANVEGAGTMLIAIPNSFEAGQATEQARKLNAGIEIIARAHSEEEEDYLRRLGANTVIMGEREIGLGMLAFLKGERPDLAPVDEEAEAAEPKAEAASRLAPAENFIAQASRPEVALAEAAAATLVAEATETEPQAEAESEVTVDAPEPAAETAAAPEPEAETEATAPAAAEAPEVIILPPPEAAPEPAVAEHEDVPPEEAEPVTEPDDLPEAENPTDADEAGEAADEEPKAS